MSDTAFTGGLTALSDFMAARLADLRAVLPDALTRLGRRDRTEVVELQASGDFRQLGWVEQSWLGAPVFQPQFEQADAGPRLVVIAPERQFRRRDKVSTMALGRGRRAVELRLVELSPLRPGEVAFGYEVLNEKDGVAEIELALVRRSDFDQALAGLEGRPSGRIAGAIDAEGRARFVFGAHRPWDRALKFLRRAGLVYAALLVCLMSWTSQVESANSQAEQTRTAAIADIRQLRARAEALEAIAGAPAPVLAHLLDAAATAALDPERPDSVHRLRYQGGDEIVLDGQFHDGPAEFRQTRLVLPLYGEEDNE